jgi:hypothetical protein
MRIFGQRRTRSQVLLEEMELSLLSVVITSAISTAHFLRPYFDEGPVNQTTYLHTIREWAVPPIELAGLTDQCAWDDTGPCLFSIQSAGFPQRYILK